MRLARGYVKKEVWIGTPFQDTCFHVLLRPALPGDAGIADPLRQLSFSFSVRMFDPALPQVTRGATSCPSDLEFNP